MSEMVRQRGIIKKLSNQDNLMEVFNKLVAEGKIDKTQADIDGDYIGWIAEDEYEVINGCLFDVSGAPKKYDDEDYVEEGEKLNDTDYRVHLYWYNGGDSPIDDIIKRADEEYEVKTQEPVFYAVRTLNGDFMQRAGSAAPALFTSEARAHSMVRLNRPATYEDGYEVVRFGELK